MIATWMLSAMLFSGLLGIAALFAQTALRHARRQVRWPWLAALIAGAAWPLMAPALRKYLAESGATGGVAIGMPTVRVVPDGLPTTPFAHWVDVALLALWAAATVVAITRLAHALLVIRRIQAASESRIVDDVPVLLTDSIGPAVVGVLKPRVLIPSSLLELDAALRRLALRHELEHCRAGDQLAVIGSAFVLALVPWNLPLWWTARRARLAIEMDCDARVLGDRSNARQYGQLLMLISQRSRLPVLAPMLAASSSHLERRIAAMLPIPSHRRRTRLAVALAAAIVVGIAACTSRISDVIAGPKPEVAKRTTTPVNADQPWLEFQVNKVAQQIPGTGKLRYPDELRAANVEGVVLAQFVVTADGVVEPGTFKELRSSNPLFTEAVKANISSMKFYPAEVKGVHVRQLVQQPFTFSLGKSASMGAATPNKASEPLLGVIMRAPMPNKAPEVPDGVNGERLAQQIPGTGNIRYPDELRKANVEGEVIAQFVVAEDGRYLDGSFKVLRSNNPLFDDAVKKALPAMRFTPARVNGKAVRQMIEQPFTFSLSKQ